VRHSRARSAGALSDRCAVEDNRLLIAWCHGLERGTLGNSNFKPLGSVIEWEINGVVAESRWQALYQSSDRGLGFRWEYGYPLPLARCVASIKIQAADTGRWHMRHREVRRGKSKINMDFRCIRSKAAHQPGGVLAQSPYGVGYVSLCVGGKPIIIRFGLFEAFSFDPPISNVGPFEFC